MTPQQRENVEGLFGLGSAWTAIGIGSWTEAGAAAATVYTIMLISYFLWRRVVRPLLERWGFKAPRKRRSDDFRPSGDDD